MLSLPTVTIPCCTMCRPTHEKLGYVYVVTITPMDIIEKNKDHADPVPFSCLHILLVVADLSSLSLSTELYVLVTF